MLHHQQRFVPKVWFKILKVVQFLVAMKLRRAKRKRPPTADEQAQHAAVALYSLGRFSLQLAFTASLLGLEMDSYRRLLFMGAPTVLYDMLKFVQQVSNPDRIYKLLMVEYFCGCAAMTRSFQSAGYPATGVDQDKDRCFENILSDQGMLFCIRLAMALAPHGVMWLGTVCSSFVWLCRSTTARSERNPRGNTDLACVSMGNQMAARSALLALLAMANRTWWVLEQPFSSIMQLHPALVYLKELAIFPWADWHVADTFMGAFEGLSVKEHQLMSSKWWIHGMSRPKPVVDAPAQTTSVVVRIATDGTKMKTTTGNKGALKESQHYTDNFGDAFLNLYQAYCLKYEQELEDDDFDSFDMMDISDAAWQDLNLGGMLSFMASALPAAPP